MRKGIISLLMVVLVVVLIGCSVDERSDYEVTSGTPGKEGITTAMSEFNLGADIAFAIDGSKPFDSAYLKIVIIAHEGDTERIDTSYEEPIDPIWDWFYMEYLDVEIVGDYTLKIYNDQAELLGAKRFSVNN